MRLIFLISVFFILLGHAVGALSQTHEPSQTTFLVLTDIHLNPRSSHSMEFAPKTGKVSNDLDVATFDHLMDVIRLNIQSGDLAEPEFVILLGDLVGHIRYSQENVMNSERMVFKKIKETFPDTPVFYNFGNNDSFMSDYGLFLSPINKTQFVSPLHILGEIWPNGNFLSTGAACKNHKTYPCILEGKTASGYYAAYLKPKLRLLAINSIMFSTKQRGFSDRMVSEQLSWIERQLNEAQELNETTLITMHIPPGYNTYQSSLWSGTAFWSSEAEERFYASIMTHYPEIIGILAGHTHKDDIKLFMHNTGTIALSGVYINPALSTSHGNAPALRSYVLQQTNDRVHWDLKDYQTYYFMRDDNGDSRLQSLYRFQDKYCTKQTNRMNDCLTEITIQKIKETMTAGNPYFQEKLSVPENIYITH